MINPQVAMTTCDRPEHWNLTKIWGQKSRRDFFWLVIQIFNNAKSLTSFINILERLLHYSRFYELLNCFSSYRCSSICSVESSKRSKETDKTFYVQSLFIFGVYMINILNVMFITLLWGTKHIISICQKVLNDLPKTTCGTLFPGSLAHSLTTLSYL